MSEPESRQQLESADENLSADHPGQHIEALLSRAEEGSLTVEEQRVLGNLLHVEVTASQSMSFAGPLPHPEVFRQYPEHIQERILGMAEKDQDHSHQQQRDGMEGAISRDRRGQHYGLVVALAGLVAATIIAFVSPTAAAIIATFDLLGLVAVFAYPRYLQDRQEKRQSKQPVPQDDEDA